MKTPNSSTWFLLLFTLMNVLSCVPQRQFSDVENQKKALEQKLAVQDSLQKAGLATDQAYQEMRGDYLLTLRQVEQLRSTNLNLNQSYQELLARYTTLVSQNRDLLTASSEVQQNLRGQADQNLLQSKEKVQQLKDLEAQLTLREQRLRDMESTYGKTLEVRNQEILDLQAQLIARDQELMRAQNTLNTSLQSNIQGNDLSIRQSAGKIYITVSQDLLFKSGSAQLDNKGKAALKDIANALRPERDMNVLVEGHSDNTGAPEKNWEISVNRALAVSMELIRDGIPPERITAAGKSQYAPIADNATREGRLLNRRTEIILVPKNADDTNLIRN